MSCEPTGNTQVWQLSLPDMHPTLLNQNRFRGSDKQLKNRMSSPTFILRSSAPLLSCVAHAQPANRSVVPDVHVFPAMELANWSPTKENSEALRTSQVQSFQFLVLPEDVSIRGLGRLKWSLLSLLKLFRWRFCGRAWGDRFQLGLILHHVRPCWADVWRVQVNHLCIRPHWRLNLHSALTHFVLHFQEPTRPRAVRIEASLTNPFQDHAKLIQWTCRCVSTVGVNHFQTGPMVAQLQTISCL